MERDSRNVVKSVLIVAS